MKKIITITLLIIGGGILSALIFFAGLYFNFSSSGVSGYGPFSIMGQNYAGRSFSTINNGYNMMGSYTRIGGYRSGVGATAKPLTVDQTKQAVEGYLLALNNPDLELKEIMIFDNNGYARITEKSTGIGAMELLVNPSNLSVFPEYGPNMVWNLKYSLMSGVGGMMGGRAGVISGYNNNPGSSSAAMQVTPDQAIKIAQQYLDKQFPGYQADTNPDPFYGYYTIDILKDGNPTGMLSVNGYTGQVFLHTWHGTFIEMWE